ncbi:MAG: aromatic ring-hydroxylating dioxygenase subunit alpha [Acidimicrobiaceae bacterium]|nr:aromatic ring-hydroxylating dioxygenase subunit alpha [Acidimicrobiaceae bacterium]
MLIVMTTSAVTFDPEHALPNAFYRDPVVHAAEMAGIWHGDWVFVTTEDAVSARGDQLPLVVGDQPVLLLRNQEGELRALSNLCAHRGTLLVERPAKAKRIQCPYHAWTYNDRGRLLAAPFTSKDAVDKAAHCLPEYRVESWHGLVFVSLNPNVEPLAERFAAVESHVVERGVDELHHYSDYQETQQWDCNWKLAIVNAMESYHLFQVHPKTLEPHTPTRDAYYITGSARATATGGRVEGADDYLLISLPPSFVGVFSAGGFYWQAVHPIGAHRCAVRTGGAFASSGGTGSRNTGSRGRFSRWLARFGSGAAGYSLPDFLPEDKAICERGQRGASSDFSPGRLVPAERVVADFGHYLNWRLNNIEPPGVHTEANQ